MNEALINELYKADKLNYVTDLTALDVKRQLANLKQLTFEVTNICNLNCRYCGYGDFYSTYEKRDNQNMKFSVAQHVIDYLWELWATFPFHSQKHEVVVGFYGGEPLINILTIRRIVDYIESKPEIPNLVLKYNMTTNAVLLDKNMDYLVEKDFKLLISLDGDKYAHSYRVDFTGTNSYDKVIHNVELLQNTYPDYFNKSVSFNSVLHDRNNVRGIRSFTKEKFDKIGLISELNQFGICQNKEKEFNKMFHPLNADIFITDDDYMEILPNKMDLFRFVGVISKNYFPTYNSLLKRKPNNIFPTGTCLPFGKKMFITVHGKILPCERIDQKYHFGIVTDEGVALNLSEVARKYTDYYRKVLTLCKKCYKKSLCSQCLFYMKNLSEHVECPSFMHKHEFIEYIKFNLNILQKYPELYQKVQKEMLFEL